MSTSGSSTTTSTSTTITSSSLPRPSLIANLPRNVSTMAAPWIVGDASLRPVPVFYPPLDPRCTTFITDATPSIVASRISECLRKRSISAEYDAEANMATCLTADRVHFTIQLYRGNRRTTLDHGTAGLPDFSQGVIVECLRVRGDTISFHHACRATLKAAMGHADGSETRPPIRTPSVDFTRLSQPYEAKSSPPLANPTQSLEHAMDLLRKDRICAQQLGLESMVMLTDPRTCGIETAIHCSLAILGADAALEDPHAWIFSLIQVRVTPSEVEEESNIHPSLVPSYSTTSGWDDVHPSNASVSDEDSPGSTLPPVEDAHHGGALRSLALRAFTNALTVLAQEQPSLLESILLVQSPRWVSEGLLSELVADLAGAGRPPAVVIGTRLASAHEATLAAICLRLLAEHSELAMDYLLRTTTPTTSLAPVLEALDKARTAGRKFHAMLAKETETTYRVLTEEVRTC